jgi:hypothetical protein
MKETGFSFSDRTRNLLKNFTAINPGMWFKVGNVQSTCSLTRDVLAVATFGESVPREFGIHDLGKFLSLISTYEAPILECKTDHITISNSQKKYNYRYVEPSSLVTPTRTDLTPENILGTFALKAVDLANVLKVVGISGHTDVVIACKDGELSLQAADYVGILKDEYSNVIDKIDAPDFKVRLKREKLQVVLPQTDYTVVVTERNVRFDAKDIRYIIAVEFEDDDE